jgi:hypothetical protein
MICALSLVSTTLEFWPWHSFRELCGVSGEVLIAGL